MYVSREGVGTTFEELTLITESGMLKSDSTILRAMRQRVGKMGGNALLLTEMLHRMGASVYSGTEYPVTEGKGIALWVPRDSASAVTTCKQAAR